MMYRLIDMNTDYVVANIPDAYNYHNIKSVISALKKRGLKYNAKTGEKYLDGDLISWYSRPDDVPKYDRAELVIKWEFAGEIKNICQKAEKGFIQL